MTHPGHIFISYKSQQRDLAFWVRDHLRERGYTTWLDVDDLKNKDDWMTEIYAALKNAAALVAIMTPIAAESRYVTGEWDIALINNTALLALEFEPTAIREKYTHIRRIDFVHTDKQKAFDQLVHQLDAVLANPLPPAHSAYRDYLVTLYDRLSQSVAQRTITTLLTYGFEGQRSAEPIRQQAEMDGVHYHDIGEILIKQNGPTLLLGETGVGKSTTVLNYARELIVNSMLDSKAPIPVLAEIATWEPNPQAPLSIIEWLGKLPGIPPHVIHLIQRGSTALLLDGLDELGSRRLIESEQPQKGTYDPRVLFLEQLSQLPPGNRILVSCRSKEYETLTTNYPFDAIVTLLPMDIEAIHQYLRDQPEVWNLILADQTLFEVVKTPLLLSFFAFVYEGMSTEERRQFSELQHDGAIRDTVFESYLRQRFDHEYRKSTAELALSYSEFLDQVGILAMKDAASNAFAAHQQPSPLNQLEDTALTKLAVHMHVLLPAQLGFQFIHVLLRNYLAYLRASPCLTDTNPEAHIAAAALGVVGDPRSVEPLMQLLKQVGDPILDQTNEHFSGYGPELGALAHGWGGGRVGHLNSPIPLMADNDQRELLKSIAYALDDIGTPAALREAQRWTGETADDSKQRRESIQAVRTEERRKKEQEDYIPLLQRAEDASHQQSILDEMKKRDLLRGGDLRGADLQQANLMNANLQQAKLQGADLQQANLMNANLRQAYLGSANVQGADLRGANLQQTNLMNASLQKANLQQANLQQAILTAGKLQGANLMNALLKGADLREANLQEANLMNASLREAKMWYVSLEGANLQGADLAWTGLTDVNFDEQTRLPDYTDENPSLWTVHTDMGRFTNPDHPAFWRSRNPDSPAYQGTDTHQ